MVNAMNDISKNVIIKFDGRLIRYLCPKCKRPIQFKKKIHGNSLCFQCGQRLNWEPVHDISTVTIQAMDTDEAAWIAKQYYEVNRMNEDDWISIDELRRTLKSDSVELYLLFLDPKAKGRFMRRYAKDGTVLEG